MMSHSALKYTKKTIRNNSNGGFNMLYWDFTKSRKYKLSTKIKEKGS